MQTDPSGARRLASYRSFVEFVSEEIRREKLAGHRKMLFVLIACFIVPAILAVIIGALSRRGLMPATSSSLVSTLILVFPIGYSIIILAREFRRGVKQPGLLNNTLREAEWRSGVSTRIASRLSISPPDLRWLIQQFGFDIEGMAYRNRYLTGLAGAVLFLLMEGIDLVADPQPLGVSQTLVTPHGVWQVSGTDLAQFVGLSLFLVLFYLSGSHACQTLRRYLRCLEGMAQD